MTSTTFGMSGGMHGVTVAGWITRRRLVVAVATVVLLLADAAVAAPATQRLSPCRLEDVARPALCGTLSVRENPARASGRRISLGIAVIPAANRKAKADPIVVLMGGPGEDAISAAAIFAEQFATLLTDRDLLLVDQRGTGKSEALRCDLYAASDLETNLRDFFPATAAADCARRLTAQADLTQYTFAHFARDLEELRRALGYGRLNLYAGSYGTRAAQVFMRAYPQSVRTAYMGSVVPIDVPTPITFAKTAERVLEATFDACAAESACHKAYPNLRHEFRQIMARLHADDVRVALPNETGAFRMYPGRVAEWFRSRLYRPSEATALPWLIHRAYTGDWTPIAEGILAGARARDSAISLGVFFAITCAEDVPFMREEEIVKATQGTVLGDFRPRQQIAACAQWPRARLPRSHRQPVRSTIPTMFVSGDTDAASPLWFTERVAAGFPNRVEVVLPGRGHTEWTPCAAKAYEHFVRTGIVNEPRLRCEATPRPPFKTE